MGSNCCKGDASRPIRSTSSIYSRYIYLAILVAQEYLSVPWILRPLKSLSSRAGASLDDRFTTSDDAGGVRLTVSAAQTGDSGVYTLQASNAAGSDTSKIRLEVSAEEAPTGEDPPSFLRRLQDLTVKVGSRTRFLVEIISSTECKVTWYRNERRLLEVERVALARDGNFWCADVAAVSVDDAGRWTCTAENAGGRASCSAHLNVLVPKAYKRPEFVEELRALLTEQGTVSLECKVVGVPTPVLRWFKDSREIKAGDVFALTANAEDPTSLGTYTCEAVNCMGRAYSSSKVHVVGRASREGSARPSSSGMTPEPPPIFTKELEDAHVKVCEHLTLGCHIVVPPWPRSVVWYNKEGKVEPGERYHVLEDGVGGCLLEIPSTEWADEGEWKCVATSAGGRVGISTCFVTMDVPKNYRKPRFMENLQAVLTEEGLVSFECKVVGFPTPVLSWFKDGQELKPGDVYQLTGTNSLGSYCCIARNCMGQASSSAELTVEDIQNQLNEEEKLQLFSKNQAPKYLQGLKSVEAKIDEPFRFTVKVAIPPEPSVLWYRDDQPVDESTRCHLEKEEKGIFNLDIQNLEFLDQAEWKCVAVNDFGHSVTSCFLKLIIPRHYKKPRFLENLQAILSDEGAVNLECKVIGVPQPVLKWYKDGEELKPGDIHRIISGQDGTCCLGTYTCEAQNCMGIAASSASLLGFDDSIKTKKKINEEQPLQRNLSLSTIHEERTSQMYDTPVGDITLDEKGEISFSFDGKEVSVSLYETPDLTEEEALQIVEMYADQLSENVTEHNVVELPPLRFVKETSTSGNLLMEAIIIDVSPDYFAAPEEDLRTEADVEDLSIADENGIPQLSLDQDIELGGENYLEKTMALLSEDRSDFAAKSSRRKSDSQRSADDFFSLSRDLSLSEEKRDDDTHISESELQSFASARSSAKVKSKSSKPSGEEGQESSEPTKTILMKEEIAAKVSNIEDVKKFEQDLEVPVVKPKRERRASRGSRRSSTGSEKSISKSKEEFRVKTDLEQASKPLMSNLEFINTMNDISSSLTKVINDVQLIEKDIILKSELMSSAATASRSLEIINSLISPLSEIHSIADAAKELISESREVTTSIFNSIPQPLKSLQQSLTIIEKCIDMESDNKTLVKKTCVAFIETCGTEIQKVVAAIVSVTAKNYINTEDKVISEINAMVSDMTTAIKFSADTIKARNLLTEASEIKSETPTQEIKHLRDTQKAVYELKGPLNSLLRIVKSAESGNIIDLSKVNHSEVIMNDMSASIQDLQSALEQIETLSIKESSSSLNKYNTEVIETVMDSVLKLRGSFEQLSTGPNTEGDKNLLTETLTILQENLTEISHKIETIDKNIGQFDILQSENKLDVLQKMAQILIALENNLPRLETMPIVKSHMATFHKKLTKILEKVIESNDAKKYQTMMEICHTVNIINSSIKNLDSESVLPLASLSNTLKIIQSSLVSNIFESELNSSIVNNISDILVGIQEAINKAEEMSLQINSENIQEFSAQIIDEAKVNVMLEHIDKTIAAVNTIKVIEITQELKLALMPALENISPILEELRRSVASVRLSGVEQDEHISEISEASFAQTIATPLCELNQNIIVLNQLMVENIDIIKENIEIVTAIAEPLHELHNNLEILQQDVVSQYGDDLTPYEVSINMASVVQNLQSCIVMIHEQIGIEGAEDMSTLEDISGIKTSADTLPSDRLVLPAAEETMIEQSLLPFTHEIATTATAQTLQTLNEHIMVLQTPEVIEALDTLSEISDYSSLKSIIVGLGDLHTGIEGILHPILIEGSMDLEDTANISKLAAIAEPMQEIQQSLSILDSSNIPVYENILNLPAEKIQSVVHNISELKKSLEQCMSAVLPAMEFTDNTIDISNKVSTLREVCEQLKEIFDTSKDTPNDKGLPEEVKNLETVVNSLIDATDVSKDIKIDHVKCITEELYLKVMGAQEDIIQFTTQSSNKISQEAKLIHMVSEVEKSIAVLEQYDFIDLSRASDITTCVTPQIAAEINSESLAQIHDIAENAVNVLQDSYKEIPIADLMIVEDFFKTCKNEFTILRCLISKATSHKKIIRLLQEFNSLQILINGFTTKRLELRLSDDVNECLTNFMIHADECLRNARTSLIKIVNTQSDILIKTPIIQLESIKELRCVIESKTNIAMASIITTLCEAVETSKCIENTLQIAIVEELSQPNQIRKPSQEEITLMLKMDDFAVTVESQSECKTVDESSLKVLDKLRKCIYQHHDYKDASGIGKTLVILKCLAECAYILQEEFREKEITKVESVEMKGKEHSLKEVLSEMLQPLQALQSQLVNIQEQILSGAEEDSISIDISTTESIMQTMTELHKDIVLQIEMDKESLKSEDNKFLIQEVDKEIHFIQHSMQSIENVQGGLAVKEITKPIKDIEMSLLTVLSERDPLMKEALPEEVSTELLQHIDQYIELIEVVEEISAVIKLEDIKETFDIARELRESIVSLDNEQNKEINCNAARAEQSRLAQKLQTALSALQVHVFDSAHELAPVLSANALQQIAQVTAQLQANLVVVTGVQMPVHGPVSTEIPAHPTQSHSKVAKYSESVLATIMDSKSFEKAGSEAEGILEDHNIMHTEMLENITKVTQDTAALKDNKLQKESHLGPSSFKELANVESLEKKDVIGAQCSQTETETELLSFEIVHPKISTVTEITTEKYSDNVEGSDALKTLKQSKVALVTVQMNLMKHITEYVSENIVEVVNEISSTMDAKELKRSFNTAHELKKCIATILDDTNKTHKDGEITDLDKQQIVLSQGLEVALSILDNDTLKSLHELVPSINKDTTEKITTIVDNLKTDLAFVKMSHEEVLKLADIVQKEFETESTSAKLIEKDVAETSQQAQLLIENTKAAVEISQTNTADSITLIPVESISKTVVSSATVSTEVLDSFMETTTMVQEIVSKQDDQATAVKCENSKEKEVNITDKTLVSVISENDMYTSEEALEIGMNEGDRQKTCAEEISDDAKAKKQSENLKKESATVRQEMTACEVFEQKLTEDSTELDVFVHIDEKVDPTAATSELVTKVEHSTDSFQFLSDATAEPVTELMEHYTNEKNVPLVALTTETSAQGLDKITTERSNLVQHINAFVTDEITEIVNEISNILKTETLKESVAVAKKLHESVMETDCSATAEETAPLYENNSAEQVHLAQTLQDALSLWKTQEPDIAEVIAPIILPDALAKVSKIILDLQGSLTSAMIASDATPEVVQTAKIGGVVDIEEQNSMVQLETLLHDVNMKINIAHADKSKDDDDPESLKDTLDEVQTVIIKLKREYDGIANDTLNETLDDLECSVRSVQLQISEESPPELLTEACATLHLLVENMNATQQAQITPASMKFEKTEVFLEKCSNETENTVKLLDMASKLDSKGNSKLENIVRNLNYIKDSLKFLRESFLVDADTVIENGVVIIQRLNQVEEQIFSLIGEIDMADGIAGDTRDCILSAVHSVYGSISNMRSTISSIQKRFMFENYGKPSESLLHSIKNVATISSFDDEENRASWKKISKSLRKVLNHFEDIKFYINLDKTARLPSDAAFTKIILEELNDTIFNVLVPRAMLLDSSVIQKISSSQKCVEIHLKSIESDSSLQVKDKIPMFKSIASDMLTTTNLIKSFFENPVNPIGKATEDTLDMTHQNESPDFKNQEPQKLAEAMETKLEEPNTVILTEMTRESYTPSIDKKVASEIVESIVVIPIEENEPSTSNLVSEDITNISPKHLIEVDVLVPLEKPVLTVETMTKMDFSETVNDKVKDVEDTLVLDAKKISETSLQSMKIKEQSQTTADIQLGNISVLSDLKATTEQKDQTKVEKEVTEKKSQTDTKPSIAETEVEVDNMSTNEHDSLMQYCATLSEIPESSNSTAQLTPIQKLEKEDEVNVTISKAKTTYEQDSEKLDKQELHTSMESGLALQETQTKIGLLKSCKVEEELTNLQENELVTFQEEQIEKLKSVENDEVHSTNQKAESSISPKEVMQELDEAKQNQEEDSSKKNTDTLKKEEGAEIKPLEMINPDEEAYKQSTEFKHNESETLASHKLELKPEQEEKDRPLEGGEQGMQDDQQPETKKQEEPFTVSEISNDNQTEKANFQSIIELEQKIDKSRSEKEMQDAKLEQNQKEKASKDETDELQAIKDYDHESRAEKSNEDKTKAEKKENEEQDNHDIMKTEIKLKAEENCDNKEIFADPNQNKEKERDFREKADALQGIHDTDLKHNKEEKARVHKEKESSEQKEKDIAEASLREKEGGEAQATKEEYKMGATKKVVGNMELTEADSKQIEAEARVEQDRNKTELKHKQEEEEHILQKETEAFQCKQQAEQQEKSHLDASDADLQDKEEEELRAAVVKNKQDKEAAEEVKPEAGFKQIEAKVPAEPVSNKDELKQKQAEKERASKVEVDVVAEKHDAEQEKSSLVEEAAKTDIKEREEHKALTTEEKKTEQDKEAVEIAEQDPDLKQIQAEFCAEQERKNSQIKQDQKEKERALKEDADALLEKQNAELQENSRTVKEAADADLNEKEERQALTTEEKNKKIRQDKGPAEKAKQDADLKQIDAEGPAGQERKDTEIKQDKKEKERALTENADADALLKKQEAELQDNTRMVQEAADADLKLQEGQEALETNEKIKKIKQNKEPTETSKQNIGFKQIEAEALPEQERKDTITKQKQQEKEPAMKEKSDVLQAKQEPEQQRETYFVKEAADADLKVIQEQEARATEQEKQDKRKASATKENNKQVKLDKTNTEKAKQVSDLKQVETKAREEEASKDTEIKREQDEKECALKNEADAMLEKQKTEQQEKSRFEKEAVDDDLEEKKDKEARITKDKNKKAAAKAKQDAALKQIKTEARAEQEKKDMELKQMHEEKERALKEEADALLEKEKTEQQEKSRLVQEAADTDLKEKVEQEARSTEDKKKKIKQDIEAAEDKAKQDVDLKQIEAESRAEQGRKLTEIKQEKEEKERVLKEEADALLEKQKADQQKKLRSVREAVDADLKEKKVEEARATKKKNKAAEQTQKTAENVKQESESKQMEAEARGEQERKDIEPQQKQEVQERELKEEADALLEKQKVEQQEKSRIVQEAADADLKEKEEQEARATKDKNKKIKQDKEAAEDKAKQDADLKQIEAEARAEQERKQTELKQDKDEKERVSKEEADAMLKQQKAEQQKKSRLKQELAKTDLKERAEQEALATEEKNKKAKQDEDAVERAKQDADLKQINAEAPVEQERKDTEIKQDQKEKERALKEKADALLEKPKVEQQEVAHGDLKENEKREALANKVKNKMIKQDKEAAEDKAKQDADFKQTEAEARAEQERTDTETKQKKEEKEQVLKKEADALINIQKAEQQEKSRLVQEAADADLKEIEKREALANQEEIKKIERDKKAAEDQAKQDANLKQIEAEARAEQERKDIGIKHEKEEKERKLKEEADALLEKQKAELQEKLRSEREAADADLKKKEELEARATKEKNKKAKQDKKDKEKATHDADLKQTEGEARAEQERMDTETKHKKEEKEQALKKEADALLDKQKAEQQEKSRLVQEAADADLKETEEREALAIQEENKKMKRDKKAAEDKAKQDADLKQIEAEARAEQKRKDTEIKQEKEEKERKLKEEADALLEKQKAELQEKLRSEREAADADLKKKEELEARAAKEKNKKAKQDKNDKEKATHDADLKQTEGEARAEQERIDTEIKQKKEEKKRALKEVADALLEKQKSEQQEKSCLVQEAADADLKETEEREKLAKKDESKKMKRDKKAAEDQAKQDADLKQIEAVARAEQERKDTEIKQEKEEKERKLKEEAAALLEKQKAEQQEKSRLVREAADVDLKKKEELEARATKEKNKKAKQEKEAAEKAKQDAELKQIEAETREEQNRNNSEQKQVEEERALKEKTDALKEKQEAEKQEKTQLLREATEAEFKEKEKQEARTAYDKVTKVKTESNASEKAKQEAEPKEEGASLKKESEEKTGRATKNKAKKTRKDEEAVDKAKEEAELIQQKEEESRQERADVEKIHGKGARAIKAAEESLQTKKNTRLLKEITGADSEENAAKDMPNKIKKDNEALEKSNKEAIVKQKAEEPREHEDKESFEHSKKNYVSEISKKTDKYTERLDKSERRDDELHIYKKESDRLGKTENGDVYHRTRPELSHEQHYIREYQYEPSTGHKFEVKEKPRFVDHNHRDYTMEFARPTRYREKSFDVDKTDSLGSHDYLGKNAAIYRAQTLVLDSQLRSSTHLFPDPHGSRTSEPLERRSEIRHKSKAHSEARSVTSDKRTGLSRDSKRKPVFSTYLTDRTAVEGSRVKLTCSILSSSDPTVTWYKNGVKLDNKLKYRTKFMDGLITMEVLNAVPSDSAEYSCTIQNENGTVTSSAILKVYPSFEASPIPPTFTRSIRDTYHLAENELVLECRIRGQPLPTITWLKDDQSISTNSRYQAYYLADGVCRLAIEHPSPEDSGKYTCKAENSVWSDQITHVVNFTGKESRLGPNVATIEKSRFNRQAMESRRPHFTNVLSDYKVASGGTIGLQVEIRGAPTRVEWLREGCSVTEVYRNAKTFVEQGLYTLALSDVTEKESGMYTCRAWSSQCHVDMNAAITVVQPNELDGKPAIIVGRPEKDLLISVGEDINISFRVQGEPKPKVVFMKGIRDITTSQRVCKMSSDDYVKFTLKRSVVSDAGTYCILARNAYGCDRAFVTVVVRQRASSDNLISDWTYPTDDPTLSTADRKYKSVPERIPGAPCVVEGGNNWISLGWPKSEPGQSAPVLAYKVESWLLGKEGGARWVELGVTPLNSFDAFNLKQGEEYHFRVTPRNRYGWGESVQTSSPAGVGLAGDRPEFAESLPGQLKVLVGETAHLSCSVKGTPGPEVVWMKNGHEIEDEDKRLSSSFNGTNCSLTIKDINVEDEARYSCEATNVHGRASTYARLAVVTDRSIWEADAKLKRERSADVEGDYPPQFTMRLRDRRVQATYPVRLTCQVIGSPDPRITWFKDGEEVTLDNRRSHFQDEHFHTLEIAPTTLEDGGVFEAMARNSSGAVSCRCSLVVDKGIRAYVAPEFCCGLEPLYRLTDGEELRISAVVEAYPSVGVTWYRDGVRLRPSRRAIMTLDRDGQIELALAAVTSRDAGVYSCTASNEVGRASTSGKVEVIGTNVTRTPPVFISPDEPYSKEPMFIRKPRSSEAREGDTVIIACEVVGDPKPDVYWLRDFLRPDYYRDSSHFKRMGDGPEYRFEIPHAKLDYTGAYSVVARNQHGEAKAVISLQILAKDPSSTDDSHNVRYGLVEVLPRFSKELTDLLSCDGDAVEFECHVSGHPEPNVRWFHYNELIRDSSDFETIFDEETARLKIKQVTAEDEGTYTCEAANNLGKVTSSACLVVYPPGEPNTLSQRLRRPPSFLSAASTPRSTPRSTPARSVSRTPGPETRRLCSPARTLAPSFYTYPFNKVAEEGDSVTLQCAIKGNPAPWATWDKDGVIITPSSRITIKEKDDVLRVLEIDEVTIDDVGVYRITIENEFGRQEASARIEVITQKGKFYAGVRAVSPSPRKSLTYRGRRPSTPRQD